MKATQGYNIDAMLSWIFKDLNGISNNPSVPNHFTLVAWLDQSRLSKRAKAAAVEGF